MPPVDAYLHRQLIAQRFWEAPQPLLPIRRVQQSLGLRDGGEVADWLREQGTKLACDRLARWLSALARAEEAGHPAACDPAARAFRERALAHLWDHLEDTFEGQVYPLLDAARRRPNPDSARLRAAAAAFPRILADASLLPGAPGGDWRALFRNRWSDKARDADGLAEFMPSWSEQLFRLLTERFPMYPLEARWRMAHTADDLARSLAVGLEAGWERFKIRGLFTTPDGGEVRDLWVYVTSEARADVQITHNLGVDTDGSGECTPAALAFHDALRHATAAAHRHLGLGRAADGSIAVHLFLDEGQGPTVYRGGSLGLAVAVAIIARATDRRINRHVAATGELQPDGRLCRVAGVAAKLRAVVAHNDRVRSGLVADVPITDVVLPEANRVDVDPDEWRACGIELHFAATLQEALLAQVLLDPWEGILRAFLATPAPDVKLAADDLAGVAAHHRTVLHCPFATDGEAVLRAIARDFASRRLTGQQAAVPVVLRLLPFAHHSAIDRQILSQLRAHFAVARAGAVDLALIRRELRRGAMALLVSGLDDLDKADAPPAFLWGILAQLSNPPYARNPAVCACRQSTWAWAARAFEQATPAFAHHILARERSTCLDRHHRMLLRTAAGRIALCRSTWGQHGGQETRAPLPSAEEFFHGGTDDFPEPCYLPVQVREIFPDGTASEAKPLTQMIASGADGVQALLLGRVGAGKSTELLKLCLDCCAPGSSSSLRGAYAPLLLDLKGKFDRRGQISYEEFLRRLLDDLQLTEELSDEELEEELRYTPRLLVMLDGLDNIEPEGIVARDAIADMLVRFMSTLHPTSCVLLTCREQERQRHHESLLRCLEGHPGLLRTLRIDDLALDGAQLRGYLRRLLRQDTLVEALLAAFEVHPDLRRTPRLLSVCISLARLYSVGEPLAPDRLYRAVVETCLEEEIHVRGKPRLAGLTPPAGVSFVQMAMGLFDVLRGWKAPQHSRMLSSAAAREILAAFLARCLATGGRLPSWWPLTAEGQRRLGVDGGRVYEEELQTLIHALRELCLVG